MIYPKGAAVESPPPFFGGVSRAMIVPGKHDRIHREGETMR